MRVKRSRRRGGFTLMEVLLVLAILVILGSLVGFFFARTQTESYEKIALTQINSFKIPLNKYKLDLGQYPANLEALRHPPTEVRDTTRWKGPYLEEDVPLDPWGNPYQFELVDDGYGNMVFRIWSMGADGQDGSEDDISNR